MVRLKKIPTDDEITKAREYSSLPILRRGSFKVAFNTELCVFLFFAVIFSFVAGYILFGMAQAKVWERFELETVMSLVQLVLVSLAAGIAVVQAFLNIGRECEYEARETEFIVRGPGKKQEIFYYSDVRDVRFERLTRPTLLGGGYYITIETGVRTVTYRYIFSENKVQTDITGTPFYYLAVNSGIMSFENTPLIHDVGLTMNAFGEMQAGQQWGGQDEEDYLHPRNHIHL